jgi:hypothetical protein
MSWLRLMYLAMLSHGKIIMYLDMLSHSNICFLMHCTLTLYHQYVELCYD